jgi:HSP20 family protein
MARLVRWTPGNIPTRTVFDRFFEDLYESVENDRRDKVAAPRLDIIENSDNVEIQVELPGISPDNVNIEFEKGVLTIASIQAETESESEAETASPNYTRQERYHGNFHRTLRIPDSINTANAEAHFANGILYLNLPKKPEAQPIRIPVKNNN